MSTLWVAACIAAAITWAPLAAQQTETTPSANEPRADSALEQDTRALASQLRCPVCQGLSIEDSPSELSQQMRALVRDQLRAGKSPDDVKRYFVSKYGEWILLSPPAHGVNTLIYALPLAALAAGATLVGIVVRRWTRAPHRESAAATAQGQVSEEVTRV